MKWENRKKKWKINHEYRRVLTLDKIMGEILQEWKEKDKVSVVRCKDCVYFKKCMTDFMGDTVELNACSYNNHGTTEDDYCSFGEK